MNSTGADGSAAGGVGVLVLLAILATAYFAPLIVAVLRRHHQVGAIGAINILAGWTFIGWVIAMAMACSAKRQPQAYVVQNMGYPPGYPPPGYGQYPPPGYPQQYPPPHYPPPPPPSD